MFILLVYIGELKKLSYMLGIDWRSYVVDRVDVVISKEWKWVEKYRII